MINDHPNTEDVERLATSQERLGNTEGTARYIQQERVKEERRFEASGFRQRLAHEPGDIDYKTKLVDDKNQLSPAEKAANAERAEAANQVTAAQRELDKHNSEHNKAARKGQLEAAAGLVGLGD